MLRQKTKWKLSVRTAEVQKNFNEWKKKVYALVTVILCNILLTCTFPPCINT